MTEGVKSLTTRPFNPAEVDGNNEPRQGAELKQVAKDFEAILVKQLLRGAKVVAGNAESGYGSMALDALSSGISDAGGIGLARQIENALDQARRSS